MSLLEVSRIETYTLEDGRVRHRMELVHHGLNRHRVIRSDDRGIVERKADIQIADWEERWERHQARQAVADRQQKNAEEARRRTEAARTRLEKLRGTLEHTLHVDDTIHWEELRDEQPFRRPRPERPALPPRPSPNHPSYSYELTVVDRLFPQRRQAKEGEARRRYEVDLAQWQQRVDDRTRIHEEAVADWEEARHAHEKRQAENNRAVDAQRERYMSGDPVAVTGYCDLVLSRSEYPDDFPQEWELQYIPDVGMLIIDYRLPAPDAIPTLSAVRFSNSRDEFVERHLSDRKVAELYDDVVYQIALRTVHEVLEADAIKALATVIFNGRVETIDPATGNEIDACLVSVRTHRDEFLELRLSHIDPARCFDALGGVKGSDPHRIVSVQPIRERDREPGPDDATWHAPSGGAPS
jgi:restriction system protein